ncbi:MAG TPA: hypothetical protein VN824_16825 [Puia sp.]|nr:hypothetical protein [Puia sp.]
MKLLMCCLFPVLLFIACHQRSASATSGDVVRTGLPDSLAGKAMGTYSGQFGKSLITVVINYISGRTVSGYDIHKGLRRNFNGEVTQLDNFLNFAVKEPGDNRYDGAFSLSLDTTSWNIKGKWIPLDSTKLKSKELNLTRKIGDESSAWDIWLANGSYDSLLTFETNGTCKFEFYNGPEDSASQLTTVKGNYELNESGKGKAYLIEWEKNSHLSPLSMKLMLIPSGRDKDSIEITAPTLQGNGWKFVQNRGG